MKEIKIFCDCNIIFEGNLHQDKPTVVLFTCEKKIVGNINENYLTDEINERNYKEEINVNEIKNIIEEDIKSLSIQLFYFKNYRDNFLYAPIFVYILRK